MQVLRGRSLAKSFRKKRVVDDVSLEVREGEVVGLLGPNGAGKTTTFHIVVGLTRPDAGSVFLGADTPVGPVYTAYGYAEGGNRAFYIFLGRAF